MSKSGTITLEFEDNRRLPMLYGEYNANLDRIEQKCGAGFSVRGNILEISGDKRICDNARQIITGLYDRLDRGGDISPEDVDAAIRMVDLPDGTPSGLSHAMTILTGVEGIAVIHFTADDVVRHPLVEKIVRAYDKAGQA